MKKKAFLKLGNGKGMKKNIPKSRELESEPSIPGNGQVQEQEWNEKIKMNRTDWLCCDMLGN